VRVGAIKPKPAVVVVVGEVGDEDGVLQRLLVAGNGTVGTLGPRVLKFKENARQRIGTNKMKSGVECATVRHRISRGSA
jgi:hypothetical protein